MNRARLPIAGLLLIAALSAVTLFGQAAAPGCSQCKEWNQPQKPFRIFGNTYYVGPHGLSSILITSSAGHVLIDGGLPESAKLIAANISALGFRMEDVKVIVNSHVHFDHAGGIAELQRMSSARVLASEWTARVMKAGGMGRGDPQYGAVAGIPVVANVHELSDGERITVGDVVITAHLTPGHTPGGTSWTWRSCEDKMCRSMVFADSLTPISAKGFRFTNSQEYPQALEDFEKSFHFLETTPCDVLITTHPDASDLWERVQGRAEGKTPDPMVNPGACASLAQRGRESLRERLAEEKAH